MKAIHFPLAGGARGGTGGPQWVGGFGYGRPGTGTTPIMGRRIAFPGGTFRAPLQNPFDGYGGYGQTDAPGGSTAPTGTIDITAGTRVTNVPAAVGPPPPPAMPPTLNKLIAWVAAVRLYWSKYRDGGRMVPVTLSDYGRQLVAAGHMSAARQLAAGGWGSEQADAIVKSWQPRAAGPAVMVPAGMRVYDTEAPGIPATDVTQEREGTVMPIVTGALPPKRRIGPWLAAGAAAGLLLTVFR